MTRILIVAITIVLSGGARAAVPEFNTEHFCGDFAEKRGGDSMGGIAKAVCVLSEQSTKTVVDKAWDHVSAGRRETCLKAAGDSSQPGQCLGESQGAIRRYLTISPDAIYASIKVCYPDAMSRQEIDAIRALLTSKPRPVSWSERRERIDEIGATWPVADDVRLEEVDVGGVPGEWSIVPGSDAARVLMFFHGGGYCSGSIVSHRRMVTEAGRAARMRTLAVRYRLAPEHPYPAAHEDAMTAWRFLRGQGVSPRATSRSAATAPAAISPSR